MMNKSTLQEGSDNSSYRTRIVGFMERWIRIAGKWMAELWCKLRSAAAFRLEEEVHAGETSRLRVDYTGMYGQEGDRREYAQAAETVAATFEQFDLVVPFSPGELIVEVGRFCDRLDPLEVGREDKDQINGDQDGFGAGTMLTFTLNDGEGVYDHICEESSKLRARIRDLAERLQTEQNRISEGRESHSSPPLPGNDVMEFARLQYPQLVKALNESDDLEDLVDGFPEVAVFLLRSEGTVNEYRKSKLQALGTDERLGDPVDDLEALVEERRRGSAENREEPHGERVRSETASTDGSWPNGGINRITAREIVAEINWNNLDEIRDEIKKEAARNVSGPMSEGGAAADNEVQAYHTAKKVASLVRRIADEFGRMEEVAASGIAVDDRSERIEVFAEILDGVLVIRSQLKTIGSV